MFIFLVIIFLAIAAYEGVRNGLVNQLISLMIYLLAFVLALVFYEPLGEFLELIIPYPSPSRPDFFVLYEAPLAFDLDISFYALLSFFIIFLSGWLVSKIVLYIVEDFGPLSQSPTVDRVGGAIISVFQAYFILFLALFILSTMATDSIQSFFADQALARAIVRHTPFLSNFFYQGWIVV